MKNVTKNIIAFSILPIIAVVFWSLIGVLGNTLAVISRLAFLIFIFIAFGLIFRDVLDD